MMKGLMPKPKILGARRPGHHERSSATKIFLWGLAMIAVAYLGLITYCTSTSSQATRRSEPTGLVDQCRELCLKYGLIATGDIAVDAKAYLEAAQPTPGAMTASKMPPSSPELQCFVGKAAPEFELSDSDGRKISLRDLRRKGTVIVVFYYGYFCSHCVAQLFGLERDLATFTKEGAQVVALSPDPATETASKFRKYGRFHFPVLSDPDNRVAELYGIYTSPSAKQGEDRKHGTFLIDRDGRIRWAYAGYQPFIDNEALLRLMPQGQSSGSHAAAAKRESGKEVRAIVKGAE
jgi:peroxiredoxin